MRNRTCMVLAVALLFSGSVGYARNTILRYLINDALNQPEAVAKLNDSIQLFFGDQEYPDVQRQLGTVTANRKTNAFNRSDKFACEWAFLSAMITLQESAAVHGGDAVINIRSYYYKNHFSSETEFECGAGALMAGVTMVGDIVKLAN